MSRKKQHLDGVRIHVHFLKPLVSGIFKMILHRKLDKQVKMFLDIFYMLVLSISIDFCIQNKKANLPIDMEGGEICESYELS